VTKKESNRQELESLEQKRQKLLERSYSRPGVREAMEDTGYRRKKNNERNIHRVVIQRPRQISTTDSSIRREKLQVKECKFADFVRDYIRASQDY